MWISNQEVAYDFLISSTTWGQSVTVWQSNGITALVFEISKLCVCPVWVMTHEEYKSAVLAVVSGWISDSSSGFLFLRLWEIIALFFCDWSDESEPVVSLSEPLHVINLKKANQRPTWNSAVGSWIYLLWSRNFQLVNSGRWGWMNGRRERKWVHKLLDVQTTWTDKQPCFSVTFPLNPNICMLKVMLLWKHWFQSNKLNAACLVELTKQKYRYPIHHWFLTTVLRPHWDVWINITIWHTLIFQQLLYRSLWNLVQVHTVPQSMNPNDCEIYLTII